MTKQEFNTLKIGDKLIYKDDDGETIDVVLKLYKTGRPKVLVEVLESKNKFINVGGRYFIYKEGSLNHYSFYNSKPKKLYKPWG